MTGDREQRVVVLNGPSGVGKTTVGRLLAARAANGVCIHGDALAGFIVSRDPDTVDRGLGYMNGATIAANYIRAGYELVVFEYVFEEPSHIQRFLDSYDARAPVHIFTLWAELAAVQARARAGDRRHRSSERVTACYEAMEANLGSLGVVVENAGAPDATAATLDGLTTAYHKEKSAVRRFGESKHRS